jgi:hypothetical protein
VHQITLNAQQDIYIYTHQWVQVAILVQRGPNFSFLSHRSIRTQNIRPNSNGPISSIIMPDLKVSQGFNILIPFVFDLRSNKDKTKR